MKPDSRARQQGTQRINKPCLQGSSNIRLRAVSTRLPFPDFGLFSSKLPTMSSNPNIDGLLTGPGPEIEAHLVEWSKTPLPEYAGTYAVVLDHVLTVAECAALSRAAEAASPDGWERALINVGMGMQELMPESRNCDRIVWDDAEIAARIWKRVAEYVPELHALEGCPGVTGTGPSKRGETWRMTRLNERMRFLRYGPGEYFRGG